MYKVHVFSLCAHLQSVKRHHLALVPHGLERALRRGLEDLLQLSPLVGAVVLDLGVQGYAGAQSDEQLSSPCQRMIKKLTYNGCTKYRLTERRFCAKKHERRCVVIGFLVYRALPLRHKSFSPGVSYRSKIKI